MASASELGHRPGFRIGATEVRPATCEVIGPGGRVTVEPRVMQVLVVLADAAGETVTRDDLTMLCWGGRVVGDDSINRVTQKIRRLADGPAAGSFTLKTIHKVGYRLCENVAEPPDRATPAVVRHPLKRFAPALLLALVAMLLVSALGFGWRGGDATVEAPASLAVLPFRNLSPGNGYFAEGVAEEIRGQLGRNPEIRVTGRTSSSQFDGGADVSEIRRKLDVAYVLEGSVRAAGDRVRVNVALVRTDDGSRLWSDVYDGRLDDIFAIQQRVGTSVAGALKRTLVSQPLSGPLVTSGDVYNLYLTARGLIRTREGAKLETAEELLRRAVALDPGYAPAWSSLGSAVWMSGPAAHGASAQDWNAEAARHIRRALALAPTLAEGHAALGTVLGFNAPEAAAHIRRAAQLDPNSAEIQFWLGNIHRNAADFEGARIAYRRSAAIDPLWHRANWHAAEAAWEIGEREETEAHVRRVEAAGDAQAAHVLRAQLALSTGDYSRAASHYAAARALGRLGDGALHLRMATVLFRLGHPGRIGQTSLFGDGMPHLWRGEPPPIEEIRRRNRDSATAYLNGHYHLLAAKLLLNAGRGGELAPLYDGDVGFLGLSARQRRVLDGHLVEAAPLVALILRAAGRDPEADRLLAQADRAIGAASRRGRLPPRFLVWAAQVWALQGEQERALAALERATDRGWVSLDDAMPIDIADEPAFRPLRGNARFDRVRTRLSDRLARERRELAGFRT